MKKTALTLMIMALSGLCIADSWTVPEKELPLPAAASPELRDAIIAWPTPDVSQLPPAPNSEAEWRDSIQVRDSEMARRNGPLIETLDIQVEEGVVAGVPVHRIRPHSPGENQKRLFIYLHGGGYVHGSGYAGIGEAALIAHRSQLNVLSVDYRMPPAAPFPAALDDAIAVYRALLEEYSNGRIAVGGSSAGGGLALATVLRAIELELPLPGAVYAGTPWADLTKTSDTLFTLEGVDRVLVSYRGYISGAAKLYAGDHKLTHPLISPAYADFDGFPPTILISGTRDMLLSDTARVHRRLRDAGVVAELHVFEGMSHAGYLLAPDSPESRDTYRELDLFFDRHLKP